MFLELFFRLVWELAGFYIIYSYKFIENNKKYLENNTNLFLK